MGKKLIEILAEPKYLAVTWQVNNYCNFKCSYCNPGNWSGTEKNNGNLGIYLQNLDIVISKYKNSGYKNFKFFFSGGEPTVWKNLIPICEYLRKEIPECTIAVNTNLSRPLKWWKEHHHLFDDVVASFHIEFANKKIYKANAEFLCDKVNYLSCKMLMHEEKFWEVVDFGNELKEKLPNYFIEWTPLFDEMTTNAKPWEYKDPTMTKFLETNTVDIKFTIPKPQKTNFCVSYSRYENQDKTPYTNSNEIIIDRQNFFMNWQCDVGDAIFINPAGAVSLASCGQGGYVGNILDEIDGVGPKSIICKKQHCHCGTDIIIPKRASFNK